MSSNPVSYLLEGSIGIIRIDNPPVNALSHSVREGIATALKLADRDDSKAVLVLCEGRTFIAGADITEFGKPPKAPSLPDLVTALETFHKPVVAAIHGNALGGGLELAMSAHYRCAVPGAKLGLPEVKLGLLPGAGGTQRLPRLIGVEAALDMMTSGTPIAAEKALQLGLIDKLIEGNLAAAAIAYTQALLAEQAPVRPSGELSAGAAPKDTFFSDYKNKIARKTRGQIAPQLIIELAEISLSTDIAAGQVAERERFMRCLNSSQSAAMRHVFFAERATAKLKDIPADTALLPVNKVAIIGAGTMGGGIAMCFANAGIPVTLVETTEEFLERGLATLNKNYATSVKRGRFTQAQVDAYLANISGTTNYADIGDVDVVIEAVFENMEVKKTVFRELDKHCKADCILASNTSYLDVDEIAAVTGRPEQVLGAHFFSPANVMKLLEVVRAEKTAPEVIKTFMKLAKTIGKIPVAVGVCHGFVGNRMLKGYGRQAQLLMLEGATPAQIDSAMESWGMAMGPIAVGDLAGLDIGYRSRRDQGIEPKSRKEFTLADTLVEMERLGQKTGAGYYRYDEQSRARQNDPEVEQLIVDVALQYHVERRDISDEEIVDRLILSLVNEGAAIVAEGIAARPSDVDIVYLNGYGFPIWRGGPLFYADSLGLNAVLEKLQKLQDVTGDSSWEPAELLIQLATEGKSFASLNA